MLGFFGAAGLPAHRVEQGIDEIQRALPPEQLQGILDHHLTPEQAGEVFIRVKPKLAVYSHIVPASATAEHLIAPTRRTYSGPLEVGEDLMVIEVGETVQVHRSGTR